MNIKAIFVLVIVAALLLDDLAECKKKDKRKHNNGRRARKHKKKHPMKPVVPLPPYSSGFAPCMIVHQSGAITIPSRCPLNSQCNVGPVADGNGAKVYRCNMTAFNACWTGFDNGTSLSASCPPGGLCNDGPYGAVLDDGTFYAVKLCSNSPPTPCSIELNDVYGTAYEPAICNSSCSIGPVQYREFGGLAVEAYFCDGPKGGACSVDYMNGTVLTSACSGDRQCVLGPIHSTDSTGFTVRLTFCNNTVNFVNDDELPWFNISSLAIPAPCSQYLCSAEFDFTYPNGTVVKASLCSCALDEPAPLVPCAIQYNGAFIPAPSTCDATKMQVCNSQAYNAVLPCGTVVQVTQCIVEIAEPMRKRRALKSTQTSNNFFDLLEQLD